MPAGRVRPERLVIRLETPSDIAAIRIIEEAAFSRRAEARLVDDLRTAGDTVFSLMAVEDEKAVGHAVLSKMAAPFRALALGPVAALPGRQRTGIGSRLIRDGIARSEAAGWMGIFVLGDPVYYGRFGFRVDRASGFESPYAGPHLMALALGHGDLPTTSGRIRHAPAFGALG
jgi:putative acetyltransferase